MNASIVRATILAAAFTITISATSRATLLPIVNPGFESPDAGATGGVYFTNPVATPSDGWSNGVIVTANVVYPTFGAEGSQVLYGGLLSQILGGNSQPTPPSQTLTSVLTANTAYTLTVAVLGSWDDLDPPPGTIVIGSHYSVQLLAGSTVLAEDFDSLPTLPDQSFQYTSLQYTALAGDPLLGQPLRIVFNAEPELADEISAFDDVTLDAVTVPEPSGLILAALAFACLFGRFRKRATRLKSGGLART